jgi:Cys-tRNA(Pro) deacylase
MRYGCPVPQPRHPITPAVRALRAAGVAFVPHEYAWVEHGGTAHSAAELGLPEHQVIKTLVMQTETGAPLLVLMHGDRKVSTKALARHLGVKTVEPCTPEVAGRHTGYLVGGTSPLGTKKKMPIYMEASIAELPEIAINGGKRGFLVTIATADLVRVLGPEPVRVAIEG